jgi:hypothetical protein
VRPLSFLGYSVAGVLLTNSAPHLLVAATGRRNRTPFGIRSSAWVNLLWGALNASGGYLLVRFADRREGGITADATAWQLPYEAGCLALALFGVVYAWRTAGQESQGEGRPSCVHGRGTDEGGSLPG